MYSAYIQPQTEVRGSLRVIPSQRKFAVDIIIPSKRKFAVDIIIPSKMKFAVDTE